MKGIGNFWGVGGGGSQRPKNLNKCIRLNWNFQRGGVGGGGGSYKKTLPWGRYGYFMELHIDKTSNDNWLMLTIATPNLLAYLMNPAIWGQWTISSNSQSETPDNKLIPVENLGEGLRSPPPDPGPLPLRGKNCKAWYAKKFVRYLNFKDRAVRVQIPAGALCCVLGQDSSLS